MLFIHNRKVKSCDAPSIRRQFGRSFEQDSRTARIIDWYIEDTSEHRFCSIKDFADEVMEQLSTKYLPIKCTHISYPGPYTIVMSGSRRTDADRANQEAHLQYTPGGYTWHHRERVIFHSRDHIECNMYLLDSNYHQSPHSGGVQEYERHTGESYH